jgi:hypothetical protein
LPPPRWCYGFGRALEGTDGAPPGGKPWSASGAEIVAKLNEEINGGLADPKMKARLADLGGMPLLLSPAEFGNNFIAEDTKSGPKW